MSSEKTVFKKIYEHFKGWKIFRNDNGRAFTGKSKRIITKDGPGVLLSNVKMISYGLKPGSPDFVGWQKIKITPEMVGESMAVFVGIEAKTKNDRLSKEQKLFLNALFNDGAFVFIAQENKAGEINIEKMKEKLK